MAKRKKRSTSAGGTNSTNSNTATAGNNPPKTNEEKSQMQNDLLSQTNPLLKAQNEFLESLPKKLCKNFFSNQHTDPSTRAEVWSSQADLGERLVNVHSWATPDMRCVKILKYFGEKAKEDINPNEINSKLQSSGGIVEIGCGANAYWSRMMFRNGIDVMAFDSSLGDGGKITYVEKDGGSKQHASMSKKSKSKKRERDADKKMFDDGFVIHRGGPEVLSSNQEAQNRVLFLCYPDEDVMDEVDERKEFSTSMGAACLENYEGDTVIHVGELFGDTPSMDQAPWGRSSGPEFQQRLAAEYHCILKAKLTNWLHVRDTISVWKRTELCSIVFQGDEDDDDDNDEEVEYRHVPEDERLPSDTAAPCCQHLL